MNKKQKVSLIIAIIFYVLIGGLFIFYLDLANGLKMLLYIWIIYLIICIFGRILFRKRVLKTRIVPTISFIFMLVLLTIAARPLVKTFSPVDEVKI